MWAKINIKSDICKFSDKNLTNIILIGTKKFVGSLLSTTK